MQVQAPAVMPKWDWAMTQDDEWLMQQWENKIMQDAVAYAIQKNCAVGVYWDGKDAVPGIGVNLPVIGSATKNGCMLDNMRKYYAMKYL